MAKTKKIAAKAPKPALQSKITKRKSLKRNTAITPKLKKISLSRARHGNKSLNLSVSEEFPESESEVEVDSNNDVQSPKHFVAAVKSPVDFVQVESGVKALFKYIQKTNDNKTELFDDEQAIFLQITSVKVPKTPNRQIRLTLNHSLLSDSSEICLIVKDVDKAKDHEGTAEHYEEFLKDKGIVNIKTIMPYHQFKTEYGNQYELVRKLLGLYDYFLVDGRIGGYVTHRLGKIFLEKRKMPTPVKMDSTNLKEHFQKSLRKTIMKLHAKSDYYIVQVGHTKMSEKDVFENVSTIIDQLDFEFPGGLDNIRSLGVKTDTSIAVPVYLTLKNKSTVNVPVVLAKRPKQFKNVTGELTTYLDRDVTVLPTGEIILTKQGLKGEKLLESDDDLFMGSDFEEEGEDEDGKSPADSDEDVDNENVDEGKDKPTKDDEKEEGEGILDQAEETYLSQYVEKKANTRKTKRAIETGVEAVPAKKGKKSAKEPKEDVNKKATSNKTNQKNDGAKQKKVAKNKKQVKSEEVNEDEVLAQAEELYLNEYKLEQTVTNNTRKLKTNKKEVKVPIKKTKKIVKTEAVKNSEVTDLKITKIREARKDKKEIALDIPRAENKQLKTTSAKTQKGSTGKVIENAKKNIKKVKAAEDSKREKTTVLKASKSDTITQKSTEKVDKAQQSKKIVTTKKSRKLVQNDENAHSEKTQEKKVKSPSFKVKSRKGKKV